MVDLGICQDVNRSKGEIMFKVWVRAVGESTFATNGREFDTAEKADRYGFDLLNRWFGAENYAVLPVKKELTGFLDIDTVQRHAVTI